MGWFDRDRQNNARFADGPPQIEGPPGIAGQVMIPRKFPASNQDVKIALVLNKTGEDDPTDAWLLSNNEALSQSSGAIVWYLATGKQASDTFFAHGGFFSPLTGISPLDVSISVTPTLSSVRVNDEIGFLLTARRIDTGTALTSFSQVAAVLPPGVDFSQAIFSGGVNVCSYTTFNRTVLCKLVDNDLNPPAVSVVVTLYVISRQTGTLRQSAVLRVVNTDTNFSNNRAEATVSVLP